MATSWPYWYYNIDSVSMNVNEKYYYILHLTASVIAVSSVQFSFVKIMY